MDRKHESGAGPRRPPLSPWRITAVYLLPVLLASQSLPLWAQMNMPGHVMEMKDQMPPDELPEPRRMTGIGNAYMEITATPEAQAWFNQGLNLLHDFWDYESARAFEQGIRADPQCAMCFWGLYKAESFYHSIAQGYAAQALAKAVGLKGKVSERERLYIEGADLRKSELWRQIVKEYPEDVQAQVFLAQAVDHSESLAILESILKQQPENSAGNHYYIHALEATDHPEQALRSAEILASLAPASGHMVHMPGHIFFRLGDYARAEQSFAAALQVDERYMHEQHVSPDNNWNYVHNLMYAIANLMEEGKLKEATALSTKLTSARGELESTLYVYSARDSISRLDPRLPVALRTANWAQAIELLNQAARPLNQTANSESRPNLSSLARQLTGFATGMQAIESRDVPKAQEASGQFDAGLKRMSSQSESSQRSQAGPSQDAKPQLPVMPDALLQPLLGSLSVMSLELQGSLLAAQGKAADAKDLFARAAEQEKALGYREPPGYIRPVGETRGAAMLASGDWADARGAYEQALLERPRSGFALYGIALTSEKSGNSSAAAKEYAAFLSAWDHADPALAQVRHAQSYLAGARH